MGRLSSPMAAPRVFLPALALLWTLVFGFSDALGGEDTVVTLLQESASPEQLIPEHQYHRIPGMMLTTNSRAVKGISGIEACQAECNRQPLCKSYSFDATADGCIWSSDRLHYDPDFVLALKPAEGDSNYEELPGMTYHSKGWMRSEGKTKEGCQDLCNQGSHCKAYAYRERDNLCMLTGNSIGMNDKWDYYEQEGVADTATGFPIKPKDAGMQKIPGIVPAENPIMLKQEIKKEKEELASEKHEVAAVKKQAVGIKQQAALQAKALGDKKQRRKL